MKCKFYIPTLIFLTFAATTQAQFSIIKQRTIGGSNYDYLQSLQQTADEGYILGGYSNSNIYGEKTENSRGINDYWVVKLDAGGAIQWDKTIGGSSYDELYSLQQTADGGYILGGYSYSNISGEKTENSRGDYDYWVIKLDAGGVIQWDKTIGGNLDDYLYSLQQTADGGYILGGYSYSNISGEKTENSRGDYDYWVIKLDAGGVIQWDKTIGGNLNDYLYSLQQTADGGYILGGFSFSNISGEKTEMSRGSTDYWVVKLDASGAIQWDKTIGGSSADNLYSLQQTSDGGYIIGGSSSSNISGEKTAMSRGSTDYWVVKLDGSGAIQWNKTVGGSDGDYLYSLQQTSDGGYILGGSSWSNISGEKTESNRGAVSADYWVVKINKYGQVQWDKTLGGSEDDQCMAIKEIAGNHYLVGGYSYSRKSGEKSQTSRGVSDYWVVALKYSKPDGPIATSDESRLNAGDREPLSIYPNPATDVLHLQHSGKAIFTLTSQAGVTVLTQTINGKGEMNISRLQRGVYYLKNNNTGEVQKILIQ